MVEATPGQAVAVEAAATMGAAKARVEAAASTEAESGQAVAVEAAAVRQWSVAVQR